MQSRLVCERRQSEQQQGCVAICRATSPHFRQLGTAVRRDRTCNQVDFLPCAAVRRSECSKDCSCFRWLGKVDLSRLLHEVIIDTGTVVE